jgi:hypothetical protein
VSGWDTLLETADIQQTLFQIDLFSAQGGGFTDPQTMPEHHQNERVIAMTMTAVPPGGCPELINFLLGEEFAGAVCLVFELFRRWIF